MNEEERAALRALLELILKRRMTPIAPFLGDHGARPLAESLMAPIEQRMEWLETEARQAVAADAALGGPYQYPSPDDDHWPCSLCNRAVSSCLCGAVPENPESE